MEIAVSKSAQMKVDVKKEGVILEKTARSFEDEGVLNPAVIETQSGIHIFYRALRSGNHSTIGHAVLSQPLTVESRDDKPVLIPEFQYESQGVEDPRITLIDGTYFMTYTAYDGYNALGALATSTDLVTFKKHGIIVPQINYKIFRQLVLSGRSVNRKYFRFDQSSHILWDKNVIFFPRRINGKLAFLHRIRPGIQIVFTESIAALTDSFWESYFLDFANHIVLDPKYDHEVSYIGGGCPPIETPDGWLLIYHSVRDTVDGYIYSACAALLDLECPSREIARLPYPLFEPDIHWEITGEVDNVCFPTGTVLRDGRLFIYYGAADMRIACASLELEELTDELKKMRIS